MRGRNVAAEPPGQDVRVEQLIAVARVLLAIACWLAVYLDPTEPRRFEAVIDHLLAGFAAYSLVALLLVSQIRPALGPRLAWALHASDFVWAAVISILTEGPTSPLFVLFVFVLLASAYRWGFVATVGNGVAATLVLVAQTYLAYRIPELVDGSIDLNRLVIRYSYLPLVAVLVGYLSEQTRRLRDDAGTLAWLMSQVDPGEGLRRSLRSVLGGLATITGARQAVAVLEEAGTGRLFMLEAWPGPRGRLRIRHVPDAERLDYLFPVSQGVSAWRIGEPTIPAQAMALHASGSLLAIPVPISAPVLPRFGWRTLEGWSFSVGEEWTGRLFLIDPRIREAAARRLTFVQTAVRQVGPALFSLFLLQRLHERAGEFARAEVARELHDGVIQSLMGLEMQLAVMQADRHQSVEALQGQIERVRNLLQQEAWNVRSLMEQLRPPAVEPARLVAYLRELVYDFRRRTGISASFVSTVNEVRLPPRLCRELSLLLREALANVRRHSGATSVMVRIDAGRLTVEDNGSGFRFAGALALPALEAAGTGPAMIMESVRAIGGGLIVESRPGSGVTLTVTFSETPRWSGVLR